MKKLLIFDVEVLNLVMCNMIKKLNSQKFKIALPVLVVTTAVCLFVSDGTAYAQNEFSFDDMRVSMPDEQDLNTPQMAAPQQSLPQPQVQPQAQQNVVVLENSQSTPNMDDIRLDINTLDDAIDPIEMQLEPVDIAPSPQELEEQIRREAYDAAITGLFPLRPDQIRDVLRQYNETEEAVKTPITGMPTPINSVKTVSLDPGVEPLVINTSYGFVTTLNSLDVTGAPWPIGWISWAGNFEVSQPEEGGYSIRIMPLDKFAYGNLVVRFLTLKTPVTFTLRASQSEVDYRVDLRIPEQGPFAQASIIQGGGSDFSAGDTTITSILDGTAPNGSEKLAVSGVDGRTSAYKLSGMTYVRTPLTLLSPGWRSSASSADGMNVYVLNDASVLLLSDKGNFFRAHLKEAEDLFDE